MKKLIIFSLLFGGSYAFGQNVRYDSSLAKLNATVAVCSSPANGVPCTNYATTYNSAGASCATNSPDTVGIVGSSCQSTTDDQGHIGFWAPAGTYDYTICVGGGCQGPFTVSLGASGNNSDPINSATSGGGFSSNCVLGVDSGINFGSAIVANSNETRFYRCFLPAPFTVGHASIFISTSPSGTAAAGLYSCVSPYPVLVKFSFDASSMGAASQSATPVVIPRGCVIFAYSASSTSMTPHTFSSNAGASEQNALTPNIGLAANASSGGVLPATLGSLSVNNTNPPSVLSAFFEY